MSVCDCCLSCSSWAWTLMEIFIWYFHRCFISHAIKWSRSVGRDKTWSRFWGAQNKQSKTNMAGHFKCGSQVHAQTHTQKPQTHFCQRGERPSYRRLKRDRNDSIKDGGAQPSVLLACALLAGLLIAIASLPDSVSLDPSQLFSVDLLSAVVSNER